MNNKKRSCLSCKNNKLCYLFRSVWGVLEDNIILNPYQDDRTPGIHADIYKAIGRACLEYREIITVE